MKILHFADLHIGVETHGHPSPVDGLSTRLHDFLDVFDELVDTAIAEEVDLVLFAGDAYKSRDPSQTHQREFARRIRRLSDAGIPVFLLAGNHDLPNARSRASALAIFDTLPVPHVTIGDRLGSWRIQTAKGPVQVVGVPWPIVSQMLTRDELRGLSIGEIDRELEERTAAGIAQEAATLDPELPAILVAHIAMADSIVKTASERLMTLGRFPQLRWSDLSPDRFDYVALGHHHCFQVLHRNPPIVYAGSLQRVDFGEEADPKGFVLLDLDPSQPPGGRVSPDRLRLRDVAARRFLTIEVQPSSEEPMAEILRAIESADVAGAIVRVHLHLTPDHEGAVDVRALQRALEPAHSVAGIVRDIRRAHRRRLPPHAQPESLTPLQAVEAYL
ncbi:MAG: metallophosphoesterase family protein, partial [Dehalococcoidia bacterium]